MVNNIAVSSYCIRPQQYQEISGVGLQIKSRQFYGPELVRGCREMKDLDNWLNNIQINNCNCCGTWFTKTGRCSEEYFIWINWLRPWSTRKEHKRKPTGTKEEHKTRPGKTNRQTDKADWGAQRLNTAMEAEMIGWRWYTLGRNRQSQRRDTWQRQKVEYMGTQGKWFCIYIALF